MKKNKGQKLLLFTIPFLLIVNVYAQQVRNGGKLIDFENIWIPDYVTEISNLKMGPIIRKKDGNVVTVEGTKCLISKDQGKIWEAYHIFEDSTKYQISNERALLNTSNGTIVLAFMNLKERANWKWDKTISDSKGATLPTYVVRSLDGGKTWEKPKKLHSEWTGAIRDIIETKNGNIVFTSMMFKHNPGRHTVLTYTSKDDGGTWERSNIIDLGGIGHHAGVTESTLEQLKDGRLWMLMRTNWGAFWETFSDDSGITWKDIKPTSIAASSAPGMLKRLASGRLLLVWNLPYPQGKDYYPKRGGDRQWSEVAASNHREELVVAFSDDEGKNWTLPKIIAKAHKHENKDTGLAWIAYPYVFEAAPGEIWITTMQSKLRVKIMEEKFIIKK